MSLIENKNYFLYLFSGIKVRKLFIFIYSTESTVGYLRYFVRIYISVVFIRVCSFFFIAFHTTNENTSFQRNLGPFSLKFPETNIF